MVEVEEKRTDSKVGRALFFLVIFALVMTIANRFYPGSSQWVGALAGFALFAAVVGGGLAIALHRLFLAKRLGPRTGLTTSFLSMGGLVILYMLTLRADGIAEHGTAMRIAGSALGLIATYGWQRRRRDRAAAGAKP